MSEEMTGLSGALTGLPGAMTGLPDVLVASILAAWASPAAIMSIGAPAEHARQKACLGFG